VIGGNFTQVWADYDLEKKKNAKRLEQDRKFITSAIQRIDPFEMSRLMYVEVWNERFPSNEQFDKSGKERKTRPYVAEFLGRANIFLDLDASQPVSDCLTLKLQDGAEGGLPKRELTGSITLQYEWTPQPGEGGALQQENAQRMAEFTSRSSRLSGTMGDAPLSNQEQAMQIRQSVQSQSGLTSAQKAEWIRLREETQQTLYGTLKVTVMGAEGLMNLTYTKGKKGGSNPYCRVFCYPTSPVKVAEDESILCPGAWRSPQDVGTLAPKWNANHTFNFAWPFGWKFRLESPESPEQEDQPEQDKPEGSSLSMQAVSCVPSGPSTGGSFGMFAGPAPTKKAHVSALVQGLGRELTGLRQELRALNSRVTRFSPELPAERM